MGILASLKKKMSRTQGKNQAIPGFHTEYALGDQLGEGGFATVYSCQKKQGSKQKTEREGSKHAVKVFDPKSARNVRKDFRLEVEIMQKIGAHPCCVQLHEAFEEKRFCYLVMEKCSCSILDAFLGSNRRMATERDLAQAFRSLLLAVDHLHSVRVVHRDIKPCNLLLKEDSRVGPIEVKLCDMGLSAIMPAESSRLRCGCIPVSNQLTEVCGTTPYMAPEMLKETPYSEVVDEWSCGVTMYVLMFGEFPYKTVKKSMEMMRELICTGRVKPTYVARIGLPQPSGLACELVAALMNRNAKMRTTAADALKYEFLEKWLPQLPLEASASSEAECEVPPVEPPIESHPDRAGGQLLSFQPTLVHARSTVLEHEECTPAERKKTFEEALAALQQEHGIQWQRNGTRCSSEPSIHVHSKLDRLPARLSTHSGLSIATAGQDTQKDAGCKVDFALPGTPSTSPPADEGGSESQVSL
jgi:serine/threonine protein kinase